TCNDPPVKGGESSETAKPNKYNCSSPYAVFKVGLYELGTSVHNLHEEIIAVGTVFIAVFTIVLGLFTVSLAQSTAALVKEARTPSERELRAYLAVKMKYVSSFDEFNVIAFSFDIKNVGNTPARNITHHSRVFLAPDRLPDDFLLPEITTP